MRSRTMVFPSNILKNSTVDNNRYLKSCQLKLCPLYDTFVYVHVVIQASERETTFINNYIC